MEYKNYASYIYGPATKNRTWIKGLGNPYTIHCTTARIIWSGVTESNCRLGGRSSLYFPLYERQII